jgi:predicted tellurium resistance membrane protein TerC
VSWRFWRDLSGGGKECHHAPAEGDTMRRAVMQIVLADISMSLDNVLGVAGAAAGHLDVLAIGLLLSVALMGAAADMIARLLERYRWISYLGLAVVLYVSVTMIWHGGNDVLQAFN